MNDSDLSKLLKIWQSPPVPGDFDQNVWRRIRTRQPAPIRPWWQAWVYSPLRLGAVAALLALSIGSWAGLRSGRPTEPAPFTFAGGATFTGTYLGSTHGHTP